MQESKPQGIILRCVLALESRVDSLYEFLGRKYPDETDVGEYTTNRRDNEHKRTDQDFEEEDDVFGHRAWVAEHNKIAMDTQIFEENK
jgi:hypothetical protein